MSGLSRRAALSGLLGVAAPAVIRLPGLLMPVRPVPISITLGGQYSYLRWNEIMRDAVQLFDNSNHFLVAVDKHFEAKLLDPSFHQ